jgi:hypothetical protein
LIFGGQAIVGNGLVARADAVDTLFTALLSGVDELNIVAVFDMRVPLATLQLTVATMVITAVVCGGNEAKVTVRLVPEPPQTPPPVELQETTLMLPEKTSFTVTEVAVAGPALPTTIVFVIWAPPWTPMGATLANTERSAAVPPPRPPT